MIRKMPLSELPKKLKPYFRRFVVNFVLFVAFFSFRHKDTKTLRIIKSFVSLCLGGKYFLVPVYQG